MRIAAHVYVFRHDMTGERYNVLAVFDEEWETVPPQHEAAARGAAWPLAESQLGGPVTLIEKREWSASELAVRCVIKPRGIRPELN